MPTSGRRSTSTRRRPRCLRPHVIRLDAADTAATDVVYDVAVDLDMVRRLDLDAIGHPLIGQCGADDLESADLDIRRVEHVEALPERVELHDRLFTRVGGNGDPRVGVAVLALDVELLVGYRGIGPAPHEQRVTRVESGHRAAQRPPRCGSGAGIRIVTVRRDVERRAGPAGRGRWRGGGTRRRRRGRRR